MKLLFYIHLFLLYLIYFKSNHFKQKSFFFSINKIKIKIKNKNKNKNKKRKRKGREKEK
jgi:hypothetical protein